MNVRPIRTEADYRWALEQVERYFDEEPRPGSPEADRFDVLSALIENYEAQDWPVGVPDPLDALREVMRMRGLTQSDLAGLLGSRSRASEVLSGKRWLSSEQAWALHAAWGVPLELLMRPAIAA